MTGARAGPQTRCCCVAFRPVGTPMPKKPTKYTISDGKLVLTFEPAEEGGYCVTSPLDPGIITEAETIEEGFENAREVVRLLKRVRADVHRYGTTHPRKKSAG